MGEAIPPAGGFRGEERSTSPDATGAGRLAIRKPAITPHAPPASTNEAQSAPIARRAAKGSMVLIASRAGTRAIDFATLLLLAHLLIPADFGIVAVAMTLVQIVEAVFELPVAQVVVRAREVERDLLDTAFTLGVLRGLVIGALLAACSVPFARIYHDTRLVPLICFLGLAPAFRGIQSPRMALYARMIDFRRDFAVEIVGKLSSFLVASTIAVATRSYWAIASGTVATPAVMALISFMLAPHRPRLALSRWREFAGFLGWMTASQIGSAINWQAGRLVLGLFVQRTVLGIFSLGSDFASLPEQAIVKPIMRPLMAAFAMVRDEGDRLADAYRRSVATMVTLGLPVMVTLGLLAEPAIRFALGPRWQAAGPMIEVLCIAYVMPLFSAPFQPLAMALGRTDRLFAQSGIEMAFRVPLTIGGAWEWGAWGVVAAQAISAVLMSVNMMCFTRRLLRLSVARQLLAGERSMFAGVVLAATLLLLRQITVGLGGIWLLLALGLCAGVGVVAYTGVLAALWWRAGRPAGIEATVERLVQAFLAQLTARWARMRMST